jgi:hypothetical protein
VEEGTYRLSEAATILEEVARLIELAGNNAPREVMNAQEAADFLRLSEAHFRKIGPAVPRHKLPSGGYRYLRSELLEWLLSC